MSRADRALQVEADSPALAQHYRVIHNEQIQIQTAETPVDPNLERIHGLVKEAQSAGWILIPDATLQPKFEYLNVTELRLRGTRSQVSGEAVFNRLRSDVLLEHIANETNISYHQETPRSALIIGPDDIRSYIAFIVQVCGRRLDTIRDFKLDPTREGISKRSHERITKHLSYNLDTVTKLLNRSLQEVTKVGGHTAVDESIWPFTGKDEMTDFLPRKPTPNGFRAFLLCARLAKSRRACVYAILPDICSPNLSAASVMQFMINALPCDVQCSITADAWFSCTPLLERYSSVRLLENYRPIPITFGLSVTDMGNLHDLFTYDLQPYESRLFYNGIIAFQAWEDNKMVITGSNAFTYTAPLPEGHRLGANCLSLPPVLSIKGAIALEEHLDLADLKSLAQAIGVAVSGSKRDIAYRIAGRIPPSTISTPEVVPTPTTFAPVTEEEKERARLNGLLSKQLQELCKLAGLHKSGNKEKLVTRLIKHKFKATSADQMMRDINDYIRPRGATCTDSKPVLTDHYTKTFNAVDMFDRYMSSVSYNPRAIDRTHCVFTNLVQLTVCQAWALTEDALRDKEVENDVRYVKTFCKNLGDILAASYT